ncbi:uncharacterized protein LOC142177292 [Nicotiana tabacum]|uniref:Uncharacterized protein LOC142177292 n=1 Tax=Nicotiana tabacum TaxID=4097 RepID=A0AC58TXD0_TOBAC
MTFWVITKEYPPNIDKDNTQTRINFQSCQNDGESLWKFDQEVIRRALIGMIVIDKLPFSFVEKEGFMKFMRIAQPLFRLYSRRAITRDYYEVYGELKQNLRSYNGEEMAKAICNYFLEWKLDKVFTVTVDNASSNDVTVKELSKKLDI